MWNFFKKLFSKRDEKKHARTLTREELLVKSAEGSTAAIRDFHGALDKLAEYDRRTE